MPKRPSPAAALDPINVGVVVVLRKLDQAPQEEARLRNTPLPDHQLNRLLATTRILAELRQDPSVTGIWGPYHPLSVPTTKAQLADNMRIA